MFRADRLVHLFTSCFGQVGSPETSADIDIAKECQILGYWIIGAVSHDHSIHRFRLFRSFALGVAAACGDFSKAYASGFEKCEITIYRLFLRILENLDKHPRTPRHNVWAAQRQPSLVLAFESFKLWYGGLQSLPGIDVFGTRLGPLVSI